MTTIRDSRHLALCSIVETKKGEFNSNGNAARCEIPYPTLKVIFSRAIGCFFYLAWDIYNGRAVALAYVRFVGFF